MSFSQLATPKKFIAVCAAAVVVSAFLPWFAAGGFSVSGIDRNGDVTLVVGLLGLVAIASNAGMIGRPRLGDRAFVAVSLSVESSSSSSALATGTRLRARAST